MPTIQIAISSDLCITLTWNLTGSCSQQQRLRRWSRMVVKQFQDGGRPLFQNRYIAISQWKIMQFWWNFVHSSRFWTSRDCIGQTLSSTERISCYYYYYYYLFCFAFFTQVAGQWPSNCRSRDTAVLDAPPSPLIPICLSVSYSFSQSLVCFHNVPFYLTLTYTSNFVKVQPALDVW